jgi:hypothetical protein
MGKFDVGERVRYQRCQGTIKRVYEWNAANSDWYDVAVTTISGIFVTTLPGKCLEPLDKMPRNGKHIAESEIRNRSSAKAGPVSHSIKNIAFRRRDIDSRSIDAARRAALPTTAVRAQDSNCVNPEPSR